MTLCASAVSLVWFSIRDDAVPDETLRAFQAWLREQEIFPMRGTTTSGPRSFSGGFHAEHADAITAWLESRGITIERLSAAPPHPPDRCHQPGCDDPPIEDSDFCAAHQD
jgi:hypothetical protein